MESGFYRFGEYILDPSQHLLRKNGAEIPLTPKVFDLLLMLLERPGETIRTEELIQGVWKDTFAAKNNLDQNLHLLRKALGDSVNGERYIKNIPKVGYRFTTKVEFISREPNGRWGAHHLDAIGREGVDVREKTRSRGIIHGLLATAATAILAFSILYGPAPTGTVTITKLTASDAVSSPAISPDGEYVAYSVARNGRETLVVKQIGTTSEAAIVPPGEITYKNVAFSPDGRTIYYSVIEPVTGRTQVFRIALFGGVSTPIPLTSLNVTGMDVSPDGRRLAFSGNAITGESTISLSQTDGSNESVLIARQHPNSFEWGGANLDWSPDGSLIAAAYRNGTDSFTRLVTVNPSDGTLHEFSEHPFHLITGISWLRDMSGLMLSARPENASSGQLWFVEYPSGKARQITKDGNDYSYLMTSADGKSMVALQREVQSRLWIVDTTAGDLDGSRLEQLTLMADTARVPSDVKVDGWPGVGWTPDGRVIFASKAGDSWDIWVMNLDGTDRRQLTTHERPDIRPSVSRDGKVVFMSRRNGVEQVWKMNLDGTDQLQLTFGPMARFGSISPDGQWAVLTAWPSGIATLWKTPVGGGEPVQLTDRPSLRPWFSPDGKFIVYDYFVNQRGRIAVIPSEGGRPVYDLDLDRTPGYEPVVKWLPGSNGLSFVKTEGGVGNVWAISLDGKQRRKLTDFKSDVIWDYAWSHDGTRLVLARGRQVKDVVLMKLALD